MNPFAAFAVKGVGAAFVAGLLSVGLVSAGSPSPSPTTAAPAQQQSDNARHHDRRAIRRVVFAAEADVLGITPEALVKDLKEGKTVAQLARAKGLTKPQFVARLLVDLTLRLDRLVDNKVITPAEAKKVLAWVGAGNVPFWNGIHRLK